MTKRKNRDPKEGTGRGDCSQKASPCAGQFPPGDSRQTVQTEPRNKEQARWDSSCKAARSLGWLLFTNWGSTLEVTPNKLIIFLKNYTLFPVRWGPCLWKNVHLRVLVGLLHLRAHTARCPVSHFPCGTICSLRQGPVLHIFECALGLGFCVAHSRWSLKYTKENCNYHRVSDLTVHPNLNICILWRQTGPKWTLQSELSFCKPSWTALQQEQKTHKEKNAKWKSEPQKQSKAVADLQTTLWEMYKTLRGCVWSRVRSNTLPRVWHLTRPVSLTSKQEFPSL